MYCFCVLSSIQHHTSVALGHFVPHDKLANPIAWMMLNFHPQKVINRIKIMYSSLETQAAQKSFRFLHPSNWVVFVIARSENVAQHGTPTAWIWRTKCCSTRRSCLHSRYQQTHTTHPINMVVLLPFNVGRTAKMVLLGIISVLDSIWKAQCTDVSSAR